MKSRQLKKNSQMFSCKKSILRINTGLNKQLNFVQHVCTMLNITGRDKTRLDIFWIRDQSLAALDNLPDPDMLAGEIIENLEAGVDSLK